MIFLSTLCSLILILLAILAGFILNAPQGERRFRRQKIVAGCGHTDDEIVYFIRQFKDAQTTFLYGCCYWFAFILHTRFPNSIIMYDLIDNHYMTKINGKLYDVSGDITEKYTGYDKLVEWSKMAEYDQFVYQRLIRDCIKKEKFYE